MNKVLKLIQLNKSKLSKTDIVIGNFISKNPKELYNISINNLATLTNTSPATITRFCKKIGCANFSEFKLLLGQDGKRNPNSSDATFGKVKEYYEEIFKATINNLVLDDLKEVTNLCKSASRVFILGIGSSGFLGKELAFRIRRMDIQGTPLTNTHDLLINSVHTTKDDLVIVFSKSGTTKELLSGVDIAKENGSKVVSITSTRDTPLTRSSDITIYSFDRESIFMENSQFSNLSTQFILDTLIFLLIQDESLKEKYNKTLSAINNYKNS